MTGQLLPAGFDSIQLATCPFLMIARGDSDIAELFECVEIVRGRDTVATIQRFAGKRCFVVPIFDVRGILLDGWT